MPQICSARYSSPLGEIFLAADSEGLTGLWFSGERFAAHYPGAQCAAPDYAPLAQARRWLDIYFSGREPDFTPPLHPQGSAFRQEVWALLLQIPYGQTVTYGALAQQMAARTGKAKMSAQAVGGAVGHNEISIIIPCHRVVGVHGNLTGYGGGMQKKIGLLRLEQVDLGDFYVPKNCKFL